MAGLRIRATPWRRSVHGNTSAVDVIRKLAKSMKNAKHIIAIAALFGLLGIFALPYVEGIKLWTLRSEGEVASQVYIALFGFLCALMVAGVGVLRGAMSRALGVVTLILFLLTFAVGAVHDGFKQGTAIGGKVLLLAAVAGFLTSLVAIVKPERKPAWPRAHPG